MREEWRGFKTGHWVKDVNVRSFIQENYTVYDGDSSFLAGPTEATEKLWNEVQALQKEERAKGGVLDMETKVVSGITAYGAAYINEAEKDLEQVVGLQTDKPLKRAFMPYGGIKMAEQACSTYGYTPDPELHKIFTEYHKTHNQGVFDAYTPEMMKARHNKILTGLPDTYGRGRIVGDYRRVALYGIDFLIQEKMADYANPGDGTMTDNVIRQREEISDQVRALKQMKEMAQSTVMTFPYLQRTRRKPFSGSTSVTSQRSRPRTVLRCPLVVYLHSLISISSVILRKVHLPRSRHRSSSTTSL